METENMVFKKVIDDETVLFGIEEAREGAMSWDYDMAVQHVQDMREMMRGCEVFTLDENAHFHVLMNNVQFMLKLRKNREKDKS